MQQKGRRYMKRPTKNYFNQGEMKDLARNRKGIIVGRWKGLEFFSSIGPYKKEKVLEAKAK
jgi:hypothetical protein